MCTVRTVSLSGVPEGQKKILNKNVNELLFQAARNRLLRRRFVLPSCQS
jgi:hypothetical protein